MKPVVLCIFDGFGIREEHRANAIYEANTPNLDTLFQNYPWCELDASQEAVGLPQGQMGNSEVGHMSIGAGRVFVQDLPKINKAFDTHKIENLAPIKDAIERLQKSHKTLHLAGLVSDGGVHSHINHIIGLANIFSKAQCKVFLHIFLDGRDTAPKVALKTLDKLKIKLPPAVQIATVCGRYFAMDRDHNWDRLEKAYRVVVQGQGPHSQTAAAWVQKAYDNGTSDEFVEPVIIGQYDGIKAGDIFLMANFRADRVRQLMQALLIPDFSSFEIKQRPQFAKVLGMTQYSDELALLYDILFPAKRPKNVLGGVLSKAGIHQFRIAETEKYAHVTFFFNGGREALFQGEERCLIPSPKVATYDLQPEMSAKEVTGKLIEAIESQKFEFVVVNYANPDMVGHTGNMAATVEAITYLDKCMGQVLTSVLEQDGMLILTADHGNAELMKNQQTGGAYTAHTLNRVPFVLISNKTRHKKDILRKHGVLSDIAPTILDWMELEKPSEMTGISLLK